SVRCRSAKTELSLLKPVQRTQRRKSPRAGEPASRSRLSITCRRRMERETGIEPATNSLEGCDSTTELLPPTRHSLSFRRYGGQARFALTFRCFVDHSRWLAHVAHGAIPPRHRLCPPWPAQVSSAGEGGWRGKDSNLRSR